jgi:hypothetical protein
VFALKRTKYIKKLVHWVQDFYQCNENPDIQELNQASFLTAPSTAASHAEICKSQMDQADATGREMTPGKLLDELNWLTWSEGLKNYLDTQIGAADVPLLYVIQ